MYSCGTPQARSDLRTEALTYQNYGLQNYGLQKHLLCCCGKRRSSRDKHLLSRPALGAGHNEQSRRVSQLKQ